MPMAKGLTICQRNLYYYFLNHQSKHPSKPCLVPVMAMQKCRKDLYVTAIHRLEEKGYVRLVKHGAHYTRWEMRPPAA